MDDDIAQENVPTTSDDMQTEEFDKQHMPTQTNEDLQQLSSDVAAFRTEDVEKNVMDEVEKAIEKQEHKRGQKYLDDLSKLRKEMEEIGMFVEETSDNAFLTEEEKQVRTAKKRRLKELKNREKKLLDDYKLYQLQEKKKSAMALQGTETERERLIRTGMMTPFGNGTIQWNRQRSTRASAAQERVFFESLDNGIQQPVPSTSSDNSVDQAILIADDEEDTIDVRPQKRKRTSKEKTKVEPVPAIQNNSDEDEADMEEPETFFEDEDEEDVKPKSKKRKRKQDDMISNILDDADEKVYKLRVAAYKAQKKQTDQAEGEGDVVFDGGFKIPAQVFDRLFEYQKTCIKWLWELHMQKAGGILGDEMGLGKTVQICSYFASLHHSGTYVPSIIVAPATVLKQWVREFHEWWPMFRVGIFHSSGSVNNESVVDEIAADPNGILVTTYESVRINQDLLSSKTWGYIILDEGHRIRNPDAEVTLACKKFETPYRIILSGTPIQNNLKELWSLFDFVFPGKLGTLPVFQAQFGIPISIGGYANASAFQVQTSYVCSVALRDIISPYLLRRVKKDVQHQLPQKDEQILFVKLTEAQVAVYKSTLDRIQIEECKVGKAPLFKAVSKLRQICNHPDLTLDPSEALSSDYGDAAKSGKLKVVQQLLSVWKKSTHRILLYSHSTKMMTIIENYLLIPNNYNYLRMDGTTPIKDRIPMIDRFNGDARIFVFLLSTKVGGIGVNLTGADRVVLYDPDWNPSVDHQALERAWRIGQKRPVKVYRLMTSGTIEEKMYHRQVFKTFLSNKVLKDPRQRRFFKSNDLHELFTLGSEYSDKNKNKDVETETSALFGDADVSKSKQAYRVEKYKSHDDESPDKEKNSDSENEEDAQKNDETQMLKSLFDKKDVKSILNHDKIVAASNLEKQIIENQAMEVAKKAAAELKKSAAQCRKFNNLKTPTWTGRNGVAGLSTEQQQTPAKRFGNKSSSVVVPSPDQGVMKSTSSQNVDAMANNSIVNKHKIPVSNDASSSPASSSQLLARMQNKTEEDESSNELSMQIKSYLQTKGGKCTSQEIVSHFSSVTGEQALVFKYLLREMCQFKEGTWTLKKSFK